MKNQNHFRRAKEMMAKIQFIMTQTSSPLLAKIQFIMTQTSSPLLANLLISDLGPYRSRGHGGGHTPKAKFGFAFAQHARINWKHVPHQGVREIARRLARNDYGFHSYAAR